MGDLNKKRWSVTYTKHINQKRKVYQDGFLDFHLSTNKVMLYDDCEKLLECRILKKDEVVSSGETLTFNSYFVDVWDPEGEHKPISDIKKQGIDKKDTKKPGSMFSDRKTDVDRNKARPNNLSPSQKIIREFKKNELHKYGTLQSSPDTTKTNITEWQVLYTTQITQKAKKYHDGLLRLTICVSSGRQVMLYDGSRKLLDRRFLKKDEVIRSGESLAFDAHLVEIGKCEEDHKPPMDLNAQGNNCNNVGKRGIRHGQLNGLGSIRYVGKEYIKSEVHTYGAQQSSPDKSSITEWQVMYTTQVTQKAKKYHDGLLRLAICGSLGRQVMLYDASRKLLSSRFLKKDEVIRPGESIAFDGYLVDIGEPEENHQNVMNLHVQGNNCNVVEKSEIMHGPQNCLKDNKSIVKEWFALYTGQISQKAKKYHSGILRLSSCGSYRMQVTLLTEDKTTLSSKFLGLSEDVKTGNTYALPKYLVEVGEQCMGSEGRPQSNICQGEDKDPNFCVSSVDKIKLSKRFPTNKPSCDGKPQNNTCSRKYADSNFSTSCIDEIKLSKSVSTNKPLRDAHQILSNLQKPMAQESVVPRSSDKSMTKPASFTMELQVSDETKDLSEDGQLPRAVLPHHGSSENVGISEVSEITEMGNSSDVMPSKAIASCSASQIIRDTDIQNSQQPRLDNMETDTKCCDEAFASNISCSSVCASHGSSDDERKSSEVLKNAREMDECPSFDLGF